MYTNKRLRRFGLNTIELIVVIAIISSLFSLLLPAVQYAREAARRTQCSNNIRQIGMGILDFESLHGRLPSNSGKTWTQRIAYQTGEVDSTSIELANLSSTEQQRLLNHLPNVFACPSAQIKTVADYPSANFGLNMLLVGRRMRDILDGSSNTLLIGEVQPFYGAPWVLGPTVNETHFGSDHKIGSHIALADGSVSLFSFEGSDPAFEALLTPAGGEF